MGWNIPDDCSQCPVCGVPQLWGHGTCRACFEQACEYLGLDNRGRRKSDGRNLSGLAIGIWLPKRRKKNRGRRANGAQISV